MSPAIKKVSRRRIEQGSASSAAPAEAACVRVRMYDVGFGDAFLLMLPTSAGEKKVLIDCGTLAQGNRPISQVAQALVAELRGTDGRPRIDVVIATHRHRDHVSGFADPVWGQVEVKEVWMPWTEHPTDPEACFIRETQSRLAAQLDQDLATLVPAGLANGPVLSLLAQNALTNETAMYTLHNGFRRPPKPKMRFLPTKSLDRTLETDVLPGIMVHVLGPSRDKNVIRDLNPPVGESYLRLAETGGSGPGAPAPFDPDWSLAPPEFAKEYEHLAPATDVLQQIKRFSQELAQAVTVSLDAAVNGTSLVLVFQVGCTCLLFPGDAQWGTWQMALADPGWRSLLKQTTFYKVAHHGSHNGTPPEFVDKLLPDTAWAMLSVKSTALWESIPKKTLVAALRNRCSRLVRSDETATPLPDGVTAHDGFTELRIPVGG